MHTSALGNATHFGKAYIPSSEGLEIVEIGSQDVNGSLRSIFSEAGQYKGLDFVRGPGVDIVLEDPYRLPLGDESVDIVLCSSVFEHSEFFWLLFLEILRILKPNGLFYLNAPSNGDFHRFPVDCWRFYPDSGAALVRWAVRNGQRPALLESFIGAQEGACWSDFVAVFVKDERFASQYPRRILDSKQDVSNARRSDVEDFIRFSAKTEDQLRIRELQSELNELRRRKGPRLEETSLAPAEKDGFLTRWHLSDFGRDCVSGDDEVFRGQLRGWALGKTGAVMHLAIRERDGTTRCYPLNEARPDVVTKILGQQPEGHPLLQCGFRYPMKFVGTLDIGFESNGHIVWVKRYAPA